MEYLGSIAKDFVFFSGDIQTTTIAMAISGSLCYSIMAAICQLLTWIYSQPIKKQQCSVPDITRHPHMCSESNSKENGESDLADKQEFNITNGDFQTRSELLQLKWQSLCKLCRLKPDLHTQPIGNYEPATKDWTRGTDEHTLVLQNPNSDSRPLQSPVPLSINLSYQKLNKWPSRLGFTGVHLSKLYLTGNKMTELPDELGCLTGLQILVLAQNNLTTLPVTLVGLRDLQILDLCQNKLTTFPDSILCLYSLKKLILSHNRIDQLPSQIKNLKCLNTLWINFNRLTFLPEEFCQMKNLQDVNCCGNSLSCLPDGIGDLIRLCQLNVSWCNLTRLPRSLTRCASLQVLQLNNNRLTSLPVQMGRLLDLKALNIEHNNISILPASLAGLRLRTIQAQGNPVVNLDGDWSDLCVTPSTEFPPLLEMTARCIYQHKVNWQNTDLPNSLKEFLRHSKQCSTCEGPCFRYCWCEVTIRPVGMLRCYPLLETKCSPHNNIPCKFRS